MPTSQDDVHSDQSAVVMEFPQYAKFPLDLRLQVVEEAIKIVGSDSAILAPLASVHSEWNHVVEKILFRKIRIGEDEGEDFGRICDRRRNLVEQVSLNFRLRCSGASDDLVRNRKVITQTVSQVFDVMKDWDRSETPRRLIILSISLSDHQSGWGVNDWRDAKTVRSLDCDFTELPKVSAIGQLRLKECADGLYFIHHSAVDVLRSKLPNLRGTSLAMPSEMPVKRTIDVARSRMIATHRRKPNLTRLSLIQNPSSTASPSTPDFQPRARKDEIMIARSLTPTVSLWAKTLVFLTIDCIIDIPQFLSTASNSMWPNLKRLVLNAILDEDESKRMDRERQYRAPRELVEGLVAALPTMRNLATVDVQFRDPKSNWWICSVCLDLSTRIDAKTLACLPAVCSIRDYGAGYSRDKPCECGSPIEGGTLVIRDAGLPGELVTELQHTVRQYRYQELAVWCCRSGQDSWGIQMSPFLPCAQWSKATGCWEFEFQNDMDVLIWQMADFLDFLEMWDYLKEVDPESFQEMLDADFEEDFGQ